MSTTQVFEVERPEPGRPISLGAGADLADAEAVRGVLEATRDRAGAVRIVREAIWFTWEQPRLPRPLVGSKYPLPYPWSRAAWLRHEDAQGRRPAGGWGLVIEHLYPRELLVADLVTAEKLTTSVVMRLLSSRIISAIITQEEDRRLPARAPAGSTWRDFETDAWLRYRGIDIAVLGPQLIHSPAEPRRSDATTVLRRRGSGPYERFWRGLNERISQERPAWGQGRVNGNDLRLTSPLRGARIKFNFSRQGLRVELLLESNDRLQNSARLELLRRHAPRLQSTIGETPRLIVEPLEEKKQARLALYLSGAIAEEHRWPEFQTWFLQTAAALERALRTDDVLDRDWLKT